MACMACALSAAAWPCSSDVACLARGQGMDSVREPHGVAPAAPPPAAPPPPPGRLLLLRAPSGGIPATGRPMWRDAALIASAAKPRGGLSGRSPR